MGLALRFDALSWGLPDVHHPDEIPILNRALAFAKGDLNPHNFLYPTLYFYALFVWEGAFFVLGRSVGLYHSVGAFEREFFVDPTHAVLAGRALTALFGTATLVAVYQFGKRLYDVRTGLIAALFLAVAPFAVRDAHYIKLDVPVTLFIVLAQAAAARLVVDPNAAGRLRDWIVAGIFVGLALSTQYYAFPIIFTVIVAALLTGPRVGWRAALTGLVAAGVASIAAFAITSPFFVLEPSIVARDMAAVKQIDIDRSVAGRGAFTSLYAYIRMLASDAMGRGVALFAALGLVLAFRHDWRRGLLLASFPLAFLAFLATTVPMSRYLNPMLPSLAAAAGFLAMPALLLVLRGESLRQRTVMGITTFLVVTPGIVGSVRADLFYAHTDTRSLARAFIERHAARGAGVLVQPHSVQLLPTRESLVDALRLHLGAESQASVKFQKQLDATGASTAPAFRVIYIGTVTDGGMDPEKIYVSPAAFTAENELQPLRAQQVTYAALNRYNDGTSAFGALDAALRREGHLVATFSPYRAGTGPDLRAAAPPFFHNTADRIDPSLERPGPIVEVWKID